MAQKWLSTSYLGFGKKPLRLFRNMNDLTGDKYGPIVIGFMQAE